MRNMRLVPGIRTGLLTVIGLLLAVVFLTPSTVAAADSYPTKPVRLIIAFAPGGSTDIVARMIAAKLSERLGKQVVPENRGGGGGTIGMEMVAKVGPRRLHAAVHLFGNRDQSPALQGAIRSPEILYPHRQDGQRAGGPHRPSERPGQLGQGAHRPGQEAARQTGLCGRRRRQLRAS